MKLTALDVVAMFNLPSLPPPQWALAKDSSGMFYYYNVANSSLTIGELPEINDVSHVIVT